MSTQKSAEVNSVHPSKVRPEEHAAFEQMVLEAAEVNANSLPALIDRAFALAFATADGGLAGIGAIKRPYDSHRRDVFTWSGSKLDPTEFPLELGWIYVKPAAQGRRIASAIVENLISLLDGQSIYATSRVDNARMHSSLKRFGFRPVGSPYPSQQNHVDIQLFVRR